MPEQASLRKPPPWLVAVILALCCGGAGVMIWMMLDTGTPSVVVVKTDKPPARPGTPRLPPAVTGWLNAAARAWSDTDAPEGVRTLPAGIWRAKAANLIMEVEKTREKVSFSFRYIKYEFITPELRLLSAAADEVRARGQQGRIPGIKAEQIDALRALSKPEGVRVGESDVQRAKQAWAAWEQADDKARPAAERELVGVLGDISTGSYDSTRRTYLVYGDTIKTILTAEQINEFKRITDAGGGRPRGPRSGQRTTP
ncbi:MAG: hypothetical protein ACHRHE_07940 [Tepidisphaerales bacterium]